jgi:hypothetical protein
VVSYRSGLNIVAGTNVSITGKDDHAGDLAHLTINAAFTAPTATSGENQLGSDFTTGSTTFVPVGLSVTLPAAGTYEVIAVVGVTCSPTTAPVNANWASIQLYNTTDGSAIAGTLQMGGIVNSVFNSGPATIVARAIITVAASKVIDLQVKNDGTLVGGQTESLTVTTASAGNTTLSYVKLS